MVKSQWQFIAKLTIHFSSLLYNDLFLNIHLKTKNSSGVGLMRMAEEGEELGGPRSTAEIAVKLQEDGCGID